eukprot:COSAG06_NODE_2126_length_7537_cov_9.348077_1_plen_39_part_00
MEELELELSWFTDHGRRRYAVPVQCSSALQWHCAHCNS